MRGRSRWVIAIWGLAFGLLILNAAVSTYNMDALVAIDRAERHSRDVRSALAGLNASLKDAEKGQRGFHITGQDEFLAPFIAAEKKVPAQLARLRDLTAADPFHASRTVEVAELLTTRMSSLRKAVDIRRAAGPDEAWQRLKEWDAQAALERIQSLIADMERHEDERLAKLAEVAKSRYSSTTYTTLLGGVLTVLMVAMAFALVRRELARREQAEREARQAADELAASQKATADSLALVDTFFANLPIGVAFFDLNLRYVRINECLAAANGLPVAAHLGRHILEAVPTMPAEMVAELRTVAASGRPVLNRQITGRPAAPDRVWLTNFFPVRTADGRPVGLGVVAQDVTERLAAENRLRESEAMYRAVVDTAVDGIITLNEQANVESYNAAAERLFGYPAAEIVGRNVRVLMPDPLALPDGRRQEGDGNALATGCVTQGRRKDGTTFPLELAVSETAVNGRRVLTEIVRDITERIRAENALRHSLDQFRTLVEAIPQLVIVSDAAGAVTHVNGRWVAYTGLPAQESRDWLAAVHPDDAPDCRECWRAAMINPPERFMHECRVRSADGDYRWMLLAAVPLLDAVGGVLHWVATFTDVDDQKRQSEVLAALVRMRTAELESANELLREEIAERTRAESRAQAAAIELGRSNEELEKFAYVASHDLQEPLRKIQAYGDRLATRFRDLLEPDGLEQIDRMKTAATRMRTLIDALLTFSRVTTQGHPFTPVSLGDVLADVLSDLELRLAQTGGHVEVGELPTIDADPIQLRQVFLNLIGNALKFHKPGVPPFVVVRASKWRELAAEVDPPPPEGEGYRITVADNGIGFDQKHAERVFEVFQRLHGRQAYEGTGIGLAICRKIVLRHGGAIAVRSRKDEGTTFIVDLPASAG